jgi:hypothetical protein
VTIDELAGLGTAGGGDDDARRGDRRWHLLDERAFLQRSLDDAEREHEAGDLSDEDHATLVARDAPRLLEVESELAALGGHLDHDGVSGPPAPTGAPHDGGDTAEQRPQMPLWRRVGIVVSCLFIALGAVVLVVHFVQSRQPGQPSSGSVTLSQAQLIEQQLQQALVLNNQGQTRQALVLYNKVLSEDPSNPAALSYAGWLQWNVGTSAHVSSLVRIGRAEVERAVHVSPTYYEGHLFDGLILQNQDHNDAAAVAQFNDFLEDGPPGAEPAQVASLVAPAYQAVGQPLPAAFQIATTSTSTP